MSSLSKQFLLVISEASYFHFIFRLTWERLCDTLPLSSPVLNCYFSSCFAFLLLFTLFLRFSTTLNHCKDHMFSGSYLPTFHQPFVLYFCLVYPITKFSTHFPLYTFATPRIEIEENETSICFQLSHGICTSCYSSIFYILVSLCPVC